MITKCRRQGQWKGVEVARGVELILHSQFADDMIPMGDMIREAIVREARMMKVVLDTVRILGKV